MDYLIELAISTNVSGGTRFESLLSMLNIYCQLSLSKTSVLKPEMDI